VRHPAPQADRGTVPRRRDLWEIHERIEDEVAVFIERELALLTPDVRGSADQLEELLDPDFGEIGRSGRLWTRGEMIAALVKDTDPPFGAATLRCRHPTCGSNQLAI
jgi:hypothetical protein